MTNQVNTHYNPHLAKPQTQPPVLAVVDPNGPLLQDPAEISKCCYLASLLTFAQSVQKLQDKVSIQSTQLTNCANTQNQLNDQCANIHLLTPPSADPDLQNLYNTLNREAQDQRSNLQAAGLLEKNRSSQLMAQASANINQIETSTSEFAGLIDTFKSMAKAIFPR